MAKPMKTLQEFADAIVAPAYRQPLKTVREAVEANGWEWADKPACCGKEVDRRSMLGDVYFAQCEACGRFIFDVTGPSFSASGSSVSFIDTKKFPEDTDWTRSWIAGQKARRG